MNRLIAYFLFSGLLAFAAFAVAIHSAVNQDKLFTLAKSIFTDSAPISKTNPEELGISINEFKQLTAYPDKQIVPKPEITAKTMVAFVFGQSNAANHGGQRFQAANANVINYWRGEYYLAADPLLGNEGYAGSPWTLMGNKLASANLVDKIILIPAAIGGTSVKDWRKGGKYFNMLESRLTDAKNAELSVTHFLWHQGEGDNPVGGYGLISLEQYSAGMKEIIELTKSYFPESKFYVALVSRCDYSRPVSLPLQQIQKDLTQLKGVYIGPDSDSIGLMDRYDACHFSASGLEKIANAWIESIK